MERLQKANTKHKYTEAADLATEQGVDGSGALAALLQGSDISRGLEPKVSKAFPS